MVSYLPSFAVVKTATKSLERKEEVVYYLTYTTKRITEENQGRLLEGERKEKSWRDAAC